jgi:hypothetical protein
MRGCHREDSGAWKPSCSTESLCFMSPEGNREISPVRACSVSFWQVRSNEKGCSARRGAPLRLGA